jgi:tetratricopeptide (TPR) repeat protein
MRWALLLIASTAIAAPKKRAEPLPPAPVAKEAPSQTRPWAEGVPPEKQKLALALFTEGNALFAESQHAAALAKYRQALESWDHPAIRYNAAVSLINLDKPLIAFENLDKALAWGEAPLGEETYKQALLYKKLLAGQLSELEVACDEPGTEVMLDGALLFRAPGTQKRRLLPGAHQLVARKPGWLTETRALQLPPGHKTSEVIRLQTVASLPMRTVRRWTWWKPWTVFAAGALVAVIGIPLIVDAKSNFDAFDAELAKQCPSGCTAAQLPSTALAARDRGNAEQSAAIGMFAVGGATLATGIVLLVLNQPRLEAAPRPVSVAPILAPHTTGLTASIRF